MFYEIRSTHLVPLRTDADGFSPQCHLLAFESVEHGDVTAVNSAKESRDVAL